MKFSPIHFLFFINILLISNSAFSESIVSDEDRVLDSLLTVVENAERLGTRIEMRKYSQELIDSANNSSSVNKNCYLGLGNINFGHSFYGPDYEFGLQYFDKAWEYILKCENEDELINYKTAIATYYAIAGQIDTASSLYMDAYNISIETDNYFSWFRINNNLARCFLELNKIEHFKCHIALAQDEALAKNDSNSVASSFRLMGNFYRKIDVKKAESYYEKSIDWSTKKNSPQYRHSLHELARFNKEIGKLDKALHFYEKYIEIEDAITKRRTKISIENIKKEYAIKEAKSKLANLKLEHQLTLEKASNQVKWNWFIVVFSCILLISLIFYYRNFKIQRELGVDLNKKNVLLAASEKKASELAQVKSQFSDTISHELRTPLHGIIGLTSILIEEEKQKLSKDGQGFLENLKFSADYLLNLINDVLEVSKINSKKIQLERKPFNLQFFISNLSSTFKYLVNKNQNRFKIEMDENIPTDLIGDPIRLSQIVINLVGNALKFTKEGEVVLRVKLISETKENVRILFEVKDTGIGIPQNKQKEVFNKFIQIRQNNFGYSGTGLGLPIVKDLLNLLGSQIHLESEIGIGSKFWFEIEFDKGTLTDLNHSEDLVYNKFGLENSKILIVDDNEINLIVSERILEKEGYQVVTCDNGFSAVQILESDDFDLILMDLHMPKMDGVAAVKEIRKGNKQIPIILLTASNVTSNWVEYKTQGFNDFVIKPYDRIDFLQKIVKNIKRVH